MPIRQKSSYSAQTTYAFSDTRIKFESPTPDTYNTAVQTPPCRGSEGDQEAPKTTHRLLERGGYQVTTCGSDTSAGVKSEAGSDQQSADEEMPSVRSDSSSGSSDQSSDTNEEYSDHTESEMVREEPSLKPVANFCSCNSPHAIANL
jgi:hypothetical protein